MAPDNLALAPWALVALLAAALTHALWNALVKASGKRLFSLSLIVASGGLLSLPAAIYFGPPAMASWPYLAASIVLHMFYNVTLVWAYRHGDLSVAYPVARGTAPLLIAAGAALFAGQSLSLGEITGLMLTSAGISMFAFEDGLPRGHRFMPFISAFTVSIMIAGYMVIDGLGLRLTPQPFSYISWLFVFDSLPLAFWLLATQRRDYVAHIRRRWRIETAGGVLSLGAYSIVLYILSFSGMAHVSALRETSVLFAVAIAAIRLHESFGPYRWAAAIVVTAGVVMMNVLA